MKIITVIFALLLSVASLSAQMAPTGVWNTGTDNSQVEITEAEGHYVGTLIASDNAKAKIGKQLLKDLKPDGEAWKGKLFAPKKGQWFDATLKEKGNLLLITVGSGFMSKTIEWTKE
jgi:uncharacterized protein (DUF2147 family)